MAKQAWYKRLWKRVITAIIAILLLIAGALVWILNAEHLIQGDWSTILPIVFLALGVIFALLTWLFPFSPDQNEAPSLPLARELVRESASFRMGDTTAANFDYITEPIKNAYDIARQALYDASIKVDSKRGILILGIANAGKTRLAFETLTRTLPNWEVFIWKAVYDRLSEVPAPTVSRGSGLVVFIDDLQEYVPREIYGADGRGFIFDNRIAILQAFLNTLQATQHLVIVASCRPEDKMRLGLGWLFDQMQVITLPSFRVEASDPETAKIIDLFQQHGATDVEDWDGTLGSLVLGLSKKRSQYEDLVRSDSPAVTVLRAMKLLSLARIPVHTHSRIQGVCTGVFGETTLQEGTKIWQESANQLTQSAFVIEVKDQATGKYALVIRKDTYFDKVITDYPAPDRPYQLDQHLEQLRKVFVGLNDYSALINLAFAQGELKRYEETLAAFEQAIRLRPNLAFLYIGKGAALDELKRHEEALTALEQAIRLDPVDARAYFGKGYVLDELKRHEEALAAYDLGIHLNPTDALAYYNKGLSLRNLKRNEEALAAFEQAIRLNPTDADFCYYKGLVLRNFQRHEEALAAFEQAIRLDPTDADFYYYKGLVLRNFKQCEEALAAFEQAIRLDPADADFYYYKGLALGELKRHEEALAAFEQAIRLDPADARAYYNKGNALRNLKRYEEALSAFEQAIRLDPNLAVVYYYKGLALRELQRYEEALSAFEQAIRLNPDYAFAYTCKGNVLDELQRYEEALTAFELAIRLRPTDARAYYNKGNALRNLKRYEEALAAFEQAIRLNPNLAVAYTGEEESLRMLGRKGEA